MSNTTSWYKIEMRKLGDHRFATLYRFRGGAEAIGKWAHLMSLVKNGVSGRRGEMRIIDPKRRVLEKVTVTRWGMVTDVEMRAAGVMEDAVLVALASMRSK